MNASKIAGTLIDIGATHALTANGFIKRDLNFHRRRGTTVQVMNFQRSLDNRRGDNVFFINIGVAFDVLWKIQGIDLNGPGQKYLEKPLEHECHFRSRLENLIPNCPRWWAVSDTNAALFRETSRTNGREIVISPEDVTMVAKFLGEFIDQAIIELNKIDSPKAFLDHHWRNVPGNQGVTRHLISVVNE